MKKFKSQFFDSNNHKRFRYVCVCLVSRTRQSSFLKHTIDCAQFKAHMIQLSLRSNNEAQNPPPILSFSSAQNQIILTEHLSIEQKKRLQSHQKRLSQLEAEFKLIPKTLVQALKKQKHIQHLSSIIVNPIVNSIIQNIKSGLRQCLDYAINKNLDTDMVIAQLQQGILEQLSTIRYAECIDQYRSNLELFNKELQQMRAQKFSTRTKARDQAGFKFWARFKKVTELNVMEIKNQLKQLGNQVRNSVMIYYRKMCASTYFSRLPQLPKSLGLGTIMKSTIPRITIIQIKAIVYRLIQEKNYQLASDLWLCSCLGLRSSQLREVYICNERNEYYDIIRFFERKNRFTSVRVVPSSLKKMICLFNVKYPMTNIRFDQLRTFCLQSFRRFYSIRGACLTEIFSALYGVNEFSRFHSNVRTSLKHYIDLESKSIIDKAFRLEMIKKLQQMQVNDSGLLLQKQKTIWVQKVYMNQQNIQIDINEPFFADEQQRRDCAFLGNTAINQNILSQSQSTFVSAEVSLAQIGISLDCEQFQQINDILDKTIPDRKWKNLVEEYIKQKKYIFHSEQQKTKTIIKAVQTIYDVFITIIDANALKKKPLSLMEVQSNQNMIVILKNQTEQQIIYKCTDSVTLQQKNDINSRLRARLRQKTLKPKKQYQFVKVKPKCQVCKQQIELEECEGKIHFIYNCKNSHKQDHFCNKESIFKAKPIFFTQAQHQIQTNIGCLEPLKTQNNIKISIQKSNKQVVSHYKYLNTIPEIIVCNLPYANQNLCKNIDSNRDCESFLPLSIQPCKNKLKGLGVFTTRYIPSECLVCSYLGQIGSNQSVKQSNDSLFSLGYLLSGRQVLQIIIIPQKSTNVARFINSSQNKKQINCRPRICFKKMKQNPQDFQLALYLQSIKPIQAGSELLYEYDSFQNTYWKIQNSEQGESQQKNNHLHLKNKQTKKQSKQFQRQNQMTIRKTKQKVNKIDQNFIELTMKKKPLNLKISKTRKIEYLQKFYPNENMRPLFKKIQRLYQYYVPILGDGNCLYRSIGLGILIYHPNWLIMFQPLHQVVGTLLSQQQIKDIQKVKKYITDDLLNKYSKIKDVTTRRLQIVELINNSDYLDMIIITQLRSLTYRQYMNSKKYKQVRHQKHQQRIKNYGKDAQDLQLNIMSDLFQLQIMNNCVIRSSSGQSYRVWTQNIVPKSPKCKLALLYRVGHYDILISNPQILEAQKEQVKQMQQLLEKNQQFLMMDDQLVCSKQIQQTKYYSSKKKGIKKLPKS